MAAIFLGVSIPLLALIYVTDRTVYISSATLSVEAPLIDQLPGMSNSTSNSRELLNRRDSVAALMVLLTGRSVGEDVVRALPNETFGELLAQERRDYLMEASNFFRGLLGRRPFVRTPEQRAVAELQRRSEFQMSKEAAGILHIRANASTPKTAMDIVNTYLQVLLNRTRSGGQEQARKMREFLESQLEQAKTGLATSEASLTRYEQQKGRIKLGGQTELDLVRLSNAENALAEVLASQQAVAARAAALQKMRDTENSKRAQAAERQAARGGETAPEDLTDEEQRLKSLKAAQENASRLEAKWESLRLRYTDAHPQVQLTQEELLAARTRVAQLARGLSPSGARPDAARQVVAADPVDVQRQLVALESEAAALKVKGELLRSQVERLRSSVRALSQEELEFTNLRRAVETNRDLATVLSERLIAARMREQSDVGGFRIMEPASYPAEPSREQLWKFVLYALALAAGCAFASALGLERWREPVETESDVESLALRPLGSVATFSRKSSVKHPTNGLGSSPLPEAASPAVVTIHHEMYRSICATIETVRPERPFRSILVTSPGPGEGKSTTAINLAYAFQEFGRRVLLIEADLRRPVLARRLQLSMTDSPSLVQFLQGSAAFEQVCRRLNSGVTVIPSSIAPGNATILLASEGMRTLLTEARDRFDVILCDSAPVLAVPDNILLIKAFEAALIVVKASATSRRLLTKTAKLLDSAGAEILGVVLNQANPRDVAYYHQRYRRYYAHTPRAKDGKAVVPSERRR